MNGLNLFFTQCSICGRGTNSEIWPYSKGKVLQTACLKLIVLTASGV